MVEQERAYEGPTGALSTDRASVTRYAVVFRAGQAQPTTGALVIGADGLRLEGGAAAARVELSIAYADLTDVRVGRNPNEPGSSFVIPPRATVKFKAGKIMRQRVEKLSRELKEAAEKRETAASRSNGQSEAAR